MSLERLLHDTDTDTMIGSDEQEWTAGVDDSGVCGGEGTVLWSTRGLQQDTWTSAYENGPSLLTILEARESKAKVPAHGFCWVLGE